MVAKNPEISSTVSVSNSVGGSGNNLIYLTGLRITNTPFSVSTVIPKPFNLVDFIVPVCIWNDRWVIVLLNEVIYGRMQVEIQAPITMVIMYFADARITCRGEFKARSDRTVDVKAPFLNVAVPPSLHLGRQRQLTFGLVDSDAGEIPAVITRAGRLWRSVRPPEAGRHIRAIASNTMLFVLPVTIWAAGIIVIFDVQDGDVRLIKHAFATVIDESKLEP